MRCHLSAPSWWHRLRWWLGLSPAERHLVSQRMDNQWLRRQMRASTYHDFTDPHY
jgi:hypothetical protein